MGSDLFCQKHPSKQQHNERHHEGDGDCIGEGQKPQRGKHHSNAADMQNGALRRAGYKPPSAGHFMAGPPNQWQQKRGLQGKPHKDQKPDRHLLAQKFRRRIGERRDNTKTEHEHYAKEGTISHGARLWHGRKRVNPLYVHVYACGVCSWCARVATG